MTTTEMVQFQNGAQQAMTDRTRPIWPLTAWAQIPRHLQSAACESAEDSFRGYGLALRYVSVSDVLAAFASQAV